MVKCVTCRKPSGCRQWPSGCWWYNAHMLGFWKDMVEIPQKWASGQCMTCDSALGCSCRHWKSLNISQSYAYYFQDLGWFRCLNSVGRHCRHYSQTYVGSFWEVDQVDQQKGDVTQRGVVLLLQATEDHSCGGVWSKTRLRLSRPDSEG